MNREMVTLAMRVALATGGAVQERSIFARKNYFYPDLPKGYQISQYDRPLATGGVVEVLAGSAARRIRLHRIHLEEDAGKSMHEFPWDDVPTGVSLVDLNRAGTPLIEIVSEPDLRSADEAYDYLVEAPPARPVGRRLGREHGGGVAPLRRERLRPPGGRGGARDEGGDQEPQLDRPREEGARARDRAAGGRSRRRRDGSSRRRASGTRRAGATKPMRGKEEAMDYRYFPEPDLGTLVVDAAWRREVEAALPELPEARAKRLEASLGLPPGDADLVCLVAPARRLVRGGRRRVTRRTRRGSRTGSSRTSSRRMTDADRQAGRVPLAPAALARLVALIDDGTISGKIAKELLPEMIATGKEADAVVKERGLVQIVDEGPIREVAREDPRREPAAGGRRTAAERLRRSGGSSGR